MSDKRLQEEVGCKVCLVETGRGGEYLCVSGLVMDQSEQLMIQYSAPQGFWSRIFAGTIEYNGDVDVILGIACHCVVIFVVRTSTIGRGNKRLGALPNT